MRLHTLSCILFTALFMPAFTYAKDPLLPDFENIVLPPNPTRSDVSKFLKDLEKAEVDYSRKRRQSSSSKTPGWRIPITARINEISSDHIDLILEKVPTFKTHIDFRSAYLRSVILRTDLEPMHAEAIGRRLPKYHSLIQVINRYKWQHQLENQIIKEAQSHTLNAFIPDFAEALARINTPAALKLLPGLLIRDSARVMADTHDTVHRISPDGIDWPEAVANTWANAKNDPDNVHLYAPIAANEGIMEALILIAKKLNSNPIDQTPSQRRGRTTMRRALLQLVDVQVATEEALIRHVLDNRDRLSFDRENRVYILK